MKRQYLFHFQRLILTCFLLVAGESQAIDIPLVVTHPVRIEEQYTVAYPLQQGSDSLMWLVQIKGNGKINAIKTTLPIHNREFVPQLLDFRTTRVRHYYFASYVPFEGKHDLPYREFCEFEGSDGSGAKCRQLDNLDDHDWIRISDFLGITEDFDWAQVLSRQATPASGQQSNDAISTKTSGLHASAELLQYRNAQISTKFGG